jgi:nitrogen regulatory protein PII
VCSTSRLHEPPIHSSLKQIIAVVKPFLAEKLVEALRRAPLEALTVREVRGYGRQEAYLTQYGDSQFAVAFLPKVEIEVWVDDSRVAEVIERITQVARTGRMGDGKLLVLPVVRFEQIIDLAAQPPATEKNAGTGPAGTVAPRRAGRGAT